MNCSKKIVVLGTGGTIAGRANRGSDNVGYTAGEIPIDELLRPILSTMPFLEGVLVQSQQVAQLDSKDMSDSVWFQLANAVAAALKDTSVNGVVVTHGTDTLEETAYFLSIAMRFNKPVVFTCSMRPSSALVPDGPQNLVDAFALALDPHASGVWVTAAGWVHAPLHLAKVHTYRVDAFSSGDAGPAGCIEEGRVRWFGNCSSTDDSCPQAIREFEGADCIAATALPRVEILVSHAGASGAMVDALLHPQAPGAPLYGLVVAGTGNGTIHVDLLAALRRAERLGVRVVRTTRCARGRVVEGTEASWPPAMPLSPVKARIALMWEACTAKMHTAGVDRL